MQFSLKKIEYSARMSEETHCFSAVLVIDGVASFEVSNHGHGGSDIVRALPTAKHTQAEVNAWIKANLPPDTSYGTTLEQDLEIVVGELMNEWLMARELRALLRRACVCIQGPELYTIGKPAQLAQAKAKYPDAVFLNDKPFDEALRLFRANAKGA